MILSINHLRSPHSVKLSPSENWLKQVATDLAPSNPASANIEGEMTISLSTAGFVHVTGAISAVTFQPCSICGDSVSLALSAPVKATFRPPYAGDAPKDMSLTSEDLDVYFIEDGGINLEIVVNDALQCAVPYQLTCERAGRPPCNNRHLASEDEQTGARSGANSPFAILKTIK